MKIMFYIGNLRKGGAERVVSILANEFSKIHEVAIMTTFDDNVEYDINQKIKLLPLDDGKKRNIVFRNIFYLNHIKKQVNLFEPDIILTFLLEPSYRMLFLKKAIKKPIIVSDRNDPKIEYNNIVNKTLMKLLYRRADGFVFQTKEAQDYFSDKIKSLSTIIFNPVDDAFFETKYEYTNSKEIVNVGRLTKQKNQMLLIKSFERVLKKYPEFKLNIYGDGTLKNELNDYIKNNNLSENVKLFGSVDNINNILKDKYAFVLSSEYEGMPNALMEALTIGLPCISTDCPCGGSRELIDNNKNGILVDNNNEKELSDAIIELIGDRKKCEKLSEEAKKSMKQFSVERISKKWLEYIKEVIKNEKNY